MTTLSLCYYSQITRVQFLGANDAVVDDGEDAATFGCLQVARQAVTVAIR
jgi:hypothetical protein